MEVMEEIIGKMKIKQDSFMKRQINWNLKRKNNSFFSDRTYYFAAYILEGNNKFNVLWTNWEWIWVWNENELSPSKVVRHLLLIMDL